MTAYTLKIKMQNNTFILDPPLAEARAYLYTQLHAQVETICGLRRVEAQRYGKYRGQNNNRERTYMSLVKEMKNYNITEAYETVEKILGEGNAYYHQWKQYQALWDLQSAQIYGMLEEDVEKWTHLLNDIRHGRKTFDTPEDTKSYGAISINIGGVK